MLDEDVVVKDLWADDSAIIRTIEATGARIIRKAPSSQFGLSGYQEGIASPWGEEFGVGGSSGGVADAVYRGEVAIGFGSDGGGSIRIPAASLGLVGVKISGEGALKPGGIFGDFISYGVITRNTTDAIRGTDIFTAATMQTDFSSLTPQNRNEVTIGYTLQNPWGVNDIVPSYREAFERTITELREKGFNLKAVEINFGDNYADFFMKLWQASAAEINVPVRTKLTELTSHLISEGKKLSESEIEDAQNTALYFRKNIRSQLSSLEIDYLLSPVLSRPMPNASWFQASGPAKDFELQCMVMPFTSWANIADLSAVSLPTVELSGQAPFSVQFVSAKIGPPNALLRLLN